jgi:hypothetical protein
MILTPDMSQLDKKRAACILLAIKDPRMNRLRLIARSRAQELSPYSKSSRFLDPTMVMNYDTYLKIDQDSDSGIPGKPGRIYKKRRHDEKIPSQKIRLTV